MHFPSIAAVRSELTFQQSILRRSFTAADLQESPDETPGTDVRLQVWDDGSWAVRVGDSQYDQDHHGFWGCSFLPYHRSNLSDIARDLLEQVREDYAMQMQVAS